jgi:hypothetical protein
MSNLIVPNEAKLSWAQAQIADTPTLTDCFLRLIQDSLILDADTTLAELEAIQADYPGYAPVQLENWSEAVIIEGKAMTEANPATFEADEDDEQELFGCYATNGAGDRLLFAFLFDDLVPVPFEAELQLVVALDFDSILS